MIKESSTDEVNPWKLFKISEIILAVEIVKKISSTLSKFGSIDLHSIAEVDKKSLLTLSDNSVPYDWRKLWPGPNLASEFLKSVAVRVQTVATYLENLDEAILEVEFSKIFNVDSFLSTMKLVSSRELKVPTSNLTLESFTSQAEFERLKSDRWIIVKVTSLLIDGLTFEGNRLVQQSGGSTVSYTPPIYLLFRDKTRVSADDPSTHSVSLYATYSREKLLCKIKLGTSLDRDAITLSGVSLVVPGN